jgi:uncharacterized protein
LLHNWLNPKAEARNTDKKGWGSFAIAPISEGETVASFGGYVVSKNELKNYSLERISRSIQISDDLYLLSGETPEPGDQVNHSCDPNCGLLGSTVVVALRDIQIGEEISYDYAMSDSDPYDEFTCECGSDNCRKLITGEDWKKPDLQKKYFGFFSSYLQQKIKK